MTANYERLLSLSQRSQRFGLALTRDLLDARGTLDARPVPADRGLPSLRELAASAIADRLVQATAPRVEYPGLLQSALNALHGREHSEETGPMRTSAQLKDLDELHRKSNGASANPPGTRLLNTPAFKFP